MLQKIIARRAAEVRTLLDQGAFADARAPLRNGGTLPAEIFARVALDDLSYLSSLAQDDDPRWQQLAKDVELLHEVALGRGYANAQTDRIRT